MSYINELKILHDGDPNLQNHEMKFAIKTLNFLMVVNGGAVVAVLAFLGNLLAIGKPINRIFIDSLTLFLFGVGSVILTSLLFYLKMGLRQCLYKKAQYDEIDKEMVKYALSDVIINFVFFISFFSAFLAFFAGAWLVRKGFLLFIVK